MVVTSDKSNFDVQFEFGDMGQKKWVEVFTGENGTLEIKSERARNWSFSGNICIEYAYDRWDAEKQERVTAQSGISTTKAAHWAQMLMMDDGSYGAMLVFPTSVVKSVVRDLWDTAKKIEVSRDSAPDSTVTRGKAYCILLPLTEIFLQLQKAGGYYKPQYTQGGNGRTAVGTNPLRQPDEIIPFDLNGNASPV